MSDDGIRFSIVVPTFERRELLLRCMASVAATRRPWPCELVVVVDGSSDGSDEAARRLPTGLPTTVIRQENHGAGAARNRGAAVARGRWLLFLDDDMTAAPDLLVVLDAVLQDGADAVVGHIPVHPDVPRTALVLGVERWVERRHARLVRSGGRLTVADLLTGQLSVRRDTFLSSGGFDEHFTAGGTFGAEDTDFLHRLVESGADVRYAPGAVTHQHYSVTPAHHLRQWRQAGRADVALVRKHPPVRRHVLRSHRARTLDGALVRALAPRLPRLVEGEAAARLVRRVESGAVDRPTRWAFTRLRDAHYWLGSREAGGLGRPGGPAVLAYHAVVDLDDEVIGDYCVTPERFREQVEALDAAGVSWIGPQDLLDHLDGRPLPAGSVLLTFDDAYAGLLDTAVPLLRRMGIPAMVLPVTGLLGDVNRWDTERGAAALPLLTEDQLRAMVCDGWSIGVHTRTHAHLVRLSRSALDGELRGALEDLRATGLPVVPVVAHPYGDHDVRVRLAARRAGYRAGLAMGGGVVDRRRSRFAVSRFEVTRDVTAEQLVAWVGRPRTPFPRQRVVRELRWVARTVLAALLVRVGDGRRPPDGVDRPSAAAPELHDRQGLR